MTVFPTLNKVYQGSEAMSIQSQASFLSFEKESINPFRGIRLWITRLNLWITRQVIHNPSLNAHNFSIFSPD
jgi:hypothetical protein